MSTVQGTHATFAQDDYVMTGEWLSLCDTADITNGCAISDLRPFIYPTGIAVDSLSNVYVVDSWKKEVQKFTSDGKFITRWGSPGVGDRQFLAPTGIAVDSFDNVYVTDLSRGDIQKFTSDGKFITRWGSPGVGDGQLITPTGIALDSSNNVYVTQLGFSYIQKFTNDGKFIMKWGTRGSNDGQFGNPSGIAVDPSSNVYVVDQHNNRIQKFTNDGKFMTKWGTKCEPIHATNKIMDWTLHSCLEPKDTEFFYPNGGISVDGLSNVYVLDQYNNRIQKFTNDGKFISTIPLPEYRAILPGYSMLGHSDIDIDTKGNKIFTTVLNDKILVFTRICYDLGRHIC